MLPVATTFLPLWVPSQFNAGWTPDASEPKTTLVISLGSFGSGCGRGGRATTRRTGSRATPGGASEKKGKLALLASSIMLS
jgi:hypothetical protein